MRERSSFARLLLTLALVAMGLKALVPAGYMLETRDRSLVVVLCSAHGGGELAFDTQTGEYREAGAPAPGDESGKTADAPCVFAAAGALAPPAASAAFASFAAYGVDVAPPPSAPAPGRGLAAPPPWATGPPVLI